MGPVARVLVVDDDIATLRAMEKFLLRTQMFEPVCAQAISAAADVVSQKAPDVGLFDVQLKEGDVRCLVHLLFQERACPQFPFVIYSGLPPSRLAELASLTGATSWHVKGRPMYELVDRLWSATGAASVPWTDYLKEDVVSHLRLLRRLAAPPLSEREQDVLHALLHLRPLPGLDRRAKIASLLGIERDTVGTHLKRAFRKLHVTSTEDLWRLLSLHGR